MPSDFTGLDELELTPRERVALQLLIESMFASAQRRMPRGLVLHGVGIDIARACMCDETRDGFACERTPEELH